MTEQKQPLPQLRDCRRIWEHAPHNAFTDLLRTDQGWFCVLREADRHVGGVDGKIRVLHSRDGEEWKSAALVTEEGVDLRDPKLSITPGGRMILLTGGTIFEDGRRVRHRTRISFSVDGINWARTQPVLEEGDWLWRLTWHEGRGYGFSRNSMSDDDPTIRLFSTEDGLTYSRVTDCDLGGRPNETTVRFLPDGRMVALVRRESESCNAFIGCSAPPYTHWTWQETGQRVGGPNFILGPDGSLWGSGRAYGETPSTVLARMSLEHFEPVLTLPSGGDNSYAGMVYHEDRLWLSYYSSHEGQAAIYLARISLSGD